MPTSSRTSTSRGRPVTKTRTRPESRKRTAAIRLAQLTTQLVENHRTIPGRNWIRAAQVRHMSLRLPHQRHHRHSHPLCRRDSARRHCGARNVEEANWPIQDGRHRRRVACPRDGGCQRPRAEDSVDQPGELPQVHPREIGHGGV